MSATLTALKALADSSRLDVVGLLAQQPRSGDELATILGTKPPTISHHIARLEDVGLVSAEAQQYYRIYALNPAVLSEYAGALTPAHLARRVSQDETIDANAYAATILSRWLKNDRLQGIPRKLQHQRAVYAWLAGKFDQNVRYDSDQVGEIVEQWCHPNFCTELIRRLVDDNYLARLADGSWYWRADSALAQQPDFEARGLPVAQSPDPLTYSATRATARKLDPDGDYAQLKPKLEIPDPDRERKLIAFRLKRGQRYTADELDVHIERFRGKLDASPATIRSEMVAEALLFQDDDGRYWRDEVLFQA